MILLKKTNAIKLALLATGFAGIVAEYILSTLASYLLGNTIKQWTLILSVMLFSMGLGSRLSKHIKKNLLETFIKIECILSLLVAYAVILSYLALAYASFQSTVLLTVWRFDGITIYTLASAIGLLIGMEIPLVTRINASYERLRTNISAVMEQDYYGSLFGGLFFAFICLPFLGITYTPPILGTVNFSVAILLYWVMKNDIKSRKLVYWGLFCVIGLLVSFAFSKTVIHYGEQKSFRDKVVFQKTTPYQHLVITQWKNDYWLYINGSQQLSTKDEYLYMSLWCILLLLHHYLLKRCLSLEEETVVQYVNC